MILASDIKARINILTLVGETVELHQHGHDWTGLCPFHAEQTPSFSVNPEKGVWYCFGCGKGGDVVQFIQERDKVSFPQAMEYLAARVGLRDGVPLPPPPIPHQKPAVLTQDTTWRKRLDGVQPLDGSPAERYLKQRGLGSLLAIDAGVQYHPSWFGRPAVVFPIRNQSQELIGAEGRMIDETDPKKKVRACGAKGGVFATPEAFTQPYLLCVEGPCNALAVAACGFPAVATMGSGNHPKWLVDRCQGKRVIYLLHDPDAAGDQGALDLCELLKPARVPIQRIKPLIEGMDWNDCLLAWGCQTLGPLLAEHIDPVAVGDTVVFGSLVCTVTQVFPADDDFPGGKLEYEYDGHRACVDSRLVFRNLRRVAPLHVPWDTHDS